MFNLIPFTGSWGKMAYCDLDVLLVTKMDWMIFMSIDEKNLVSFPKNLFILSIYCILPMFMNKKYFIFPLKKIFFILFFIFQSQAKADSSSADRIKTCLPHVKRNLQQNLNIRVSEGDLEISDDGQIIKLSSEVLDSSTRFQHYPHIFFDQIKWCPIMESFDLVVSHLSKIGFDPSEMNQFLKKRLHQAEVAELPALKYQIGESWDRKPLKTVLEQDPNPILGKLSKSYILAQYYKPLADGKEKYIYWTGSVYFGSFDKYEVFSLPYHALIEEGSEEIVTCNNFKFSSPAIKKKKIPGHRQILSLPSVDIVFCLLDLRDTDHNLIATEIDWSQDFHEQIELITLGTGSHNPSGETEITIDFSHECRSLVPLTEAQYYGPDKRFPGNYRLAMGCDVSKGNSGDGVFEKQTGKYIGMVTTTSLYTFPQLASSVMDGTLETQRLYGETSHIIPIPLIKETLEKLLESNETPLEQKDFVRWLLEQKHH